MSRVLFIEWGEQGNLIRSTIVDTSETDAFYVPKTMMEADLNVHRVTFYREADSLGRGGWEYVGDVKGPAKPIPKFHRGEFVVRLVLLRRD